ncbi:FHA domain-containing protein [Eubacterium sp. MSJ-13]|uniref:DUF6382 domain-containing protein n=1 Tax=Eubacterium sp. MSJ-13 TaxID=2841513 RepID=UPI001C10A076|nr:DUF6382 domain-containing protein [Eubacterium sp. MSJ-13]MBU5477925.1 FHA domain-containing protein [Eubacterium sp. MSJ-13]
MESKIEYKRKDGVSGSYIVFEIDCIYEESVEVKMLQNNNISGILSCDFRYEDNRLYLYYDTTDKTVVSDIMKGQEMTYDLLYGLYQAFIKTMKRCEKYLISADSILFRKDLIFGNRKCRELEFCVLPGMNSSFRKQLKSLTEEFMKISDHEDRKCVEFIYGIYDIVSENNFHVSDMENFLNEQGILDTDEKNRVSGSSNVIEAESDDSSEIRYKDTEQNMDKISDYDTGECFCLVKRNTKNIFIKEFVPHMINVKKSISFGCGAKDIVHIGRSSENEVMFPQNYISRSHAILEADENFLYVTDRGSLNGTFVNGERIATNVKTRCRVHDEITFADICFVVT